MCRKCFNGTTRRVCVEHREIMTNTWHGGSTHCSKCGSEGVVVGMKWRAPKTGDDKSWNLIASGDWFWDKKAIARKSSKHRLYRDNVVKTREWHLKYDV